MRWKAKLIGIAAAAGAFIALGAAAPASAQVSFSFGVYGGGPFAAPSNCYWERVDRRRGDIVQQVCRDPWGRAYVVPGSRYRLEDRRYWSHWRDGRWDRDWNRRNDWNRGWDRDRRRDWDRRDRDRRDRDWDRDRRRDRDWDRRNRR